MGKNGNDQRTSTREVEGGMTDCATMHRGSRQQTEQQRSLPIEGRCLGRSVNAAAAATDGKH